MRMIVANAYRPVPYPMGEAIPNVPMRPDASRRLWTGEIFISILYYLPLYCDVINIGNFFINFNFYEQTFTILNTSFVNFCKI